MNDLLKALSVFGLVVGIPFTCCVGLLMIGRIKCLEWLRDVGKVLGFMSGVFALLSIPCVIVMVAYWVVYRRMF